MNPSPAPHWIDSHCHLHDLDEVPKLLVHASNAQVDRLILVGTTVQSSEAAIAIASEYTSGRGATGITPLLYSTVGIHPHDAKEGTSAIEELLAQPGALVKEGPKEPGQIIGIGECGLDFHYDYAPREAQRETFVGQIELARRLGLTLVIHTREAWSETLAILTAEELPERVIIHCFTGGPEEARRCLDLGAYLSFSGIVTFKNAEELRAAALLCPSDRLLVETDAPYLAPVPHRGSPNEPAYVALVGASIAALRGAEVVEFAEQTVTNTLEAFELAR